MMIANCTIHYLEVNRLLGTFFAAASNSSGSVPRFLNQLIRLDD